MGMNHPSLCPCYRKFVILKGKSEFDWSYWRRKGVTSSQKGFSQWNKGYKRLEKMRRGRISEEKKGKWGAGGNGKRQKTEGKREVQGGEEERDKMIEIEEQMKKMKVRRGARGWRGFTGNKREEDRGRGNDRIITQGERRWRKEEDEEVPGGGDQTRILSQTPLRCLNLVCKLEF